MSKIKWGQRCIARMYADKDLHYFNEDKKFFLDKECLIVEVQEDVNIAKIIMHNQLCCYWDISALEPIPETQSVWWPKIGERVVHRGQIKTVTDRNLITHQLDRDDWVHVQNLSPVTTTEITPEEAVALLEQHTGKSFTIKK
jgi:hypothetical protein